jgi:hypothetical protein
MVHVYDQSVTIPIDQPLANRVLLEMSWKILLLVNGISGMLYYLASKHTST